MTDHQIVDADGLDVIEALIADATAVEGVAAVHEGSGYFAERVIRRAVQQGTLIVVGPENHPAHRSLSPQPPVETGDDDAELRIVFDGPPSHESGRFVECETADGRSVNAGQWHERPDGLWELRIASRLSVSTGDDELVARLRADIAELNANPAETTGAPHSFYEAANRLEDLSHKFPATAALNASTPEIQRLRAEVRLAMQALSAFGDTEEGVTTAYNILKDVAQ